MEAAFLSSGPSRVVDSAPAGDGWLAVGGPGIVMVLRPVVHDPVEQAVLEAYGQAPGGAPHYLRQEAPRTRAVQRIGGGLAGWGPLVPYVSGPRCATGPRRKRPCACCSLSRWC